MSNLVFISGEFGSGTTLLFTLFRKTPGFHCLYEPLHGQLPEFLVWRDRVYEHHFFVEDYYSEYKGFTQVAQLFSPDWATTRLALSPNDEADDLYRYLSYLIGMSFGKAPGVVLKENRFAFRLGWLRAEFPRARVIHIYRDPEEQWASLVRRVQGHLGRQDVGQESVEYQGFRLAATCDDLTTAFPELDASNFRTAYARFAKLMELSRAEQERYAHVSVDYADLVGDFQNVCPRIASAIGVDLDVEHLNQFVVLDPNRELNNRPHSLPQRLRRLVERGGRSYARIRVQAAKRRAKASS